MLEMVKSTAELERLLVSGPQLRQLFEIERLL